MAPAFLAERLCRSSAFERSRSASPDHFLAVSFQQIDASILSRFELASHPLQHRRGLRPRPDWFSSLVRDDRFHPTC